MKALPILKTLPYCRLSRIMGKGKRRTEEEKAFRLRARHKNQKENLNASGHVNKSTTMLDATTEIDE